METLQQILALWLSLAGVGAGIALLINIGKTTGVVKDGQAQTWSAGLNLVGIVAVFVLKLVKPDLDWTFIDSQAQVLAEIGTLAFGFVLQLLSAKTTHAAVRNVPVIGKSYGSAK